MVDEEGKIFAPDFGGPNVKKFKFLGATIYYAVFKNMGEDGDTFGTGMEDFDRRFDAGRNFDDHHSPRFDNKAKYLYLYQIVNDRFLTPRATKVKGEDKQGKVHNPLFDPEMKGDAIPPADPIQQFALKLLVDPRFITSWGHFRDAGFVADVADVDIRGDTVKETAGDGKKKFERDREIRLAFSYLPAVTSKLPNPGYKEMAKPNLLGDLQKGFGVGNSSLNLKESKAYNDLKLVAGQAEKQKNLKWASYVENLLKSAEAGRDPDFVQLNYPKIDPNNPKDPGRPGPGHRHFVDEVAYSFFRVTWQAGKSLKQGDRSVLVGFTTDLPPVFAPVRTDNEKSAEVGKELQLSGGPPVIRGKDLEPIANQNPKEQFTALLDLKNDPANNNDFRFTQAGGEGAGSGSAYGTVPTPTPPPPVPVADGRILQAPGGPGSGGAVGGGGGGVAGTGGIGVGNGGGALFGFPGLGGAFSRDSGGGFGGGFGSGFGNGNGARIADAGARQAQAGGQILTINFNATLANQQAQQQSQSQFQQQQQQQNQHQKNRDGHHANGCANQGHVVSAPASLILGLLGLPSLWFLRRRKGTETTSETVHATV
jgi:hypothetical protein